MKVHLLYEKSRPPIRPHLPKAGHASYMKVHLLFDKPRPLQQRPRLHAKARPFPHGPGLLTGRPLEQGHASSNHATQITAQPDDVPWLL